MARLLFIDDEAELMPGVINGLKAAGHEVAIKTTGCDALAELRERRSNYDLVILDLMMARGTAINPADEIADMSNEKVGEEIYRRFAFLGQELPVIILTAVRSSMENMDGMRQGPKATLLTKPVSVPELLHEIDTLLQVA